MEYCNDIADIKDFYRSARFPYVEFFLKLYYPHLTDTGKESIKIKLQNYLSGKSRKHHPEFYNKLLIIYTFHFYTPRGKWTQ